MAGTSTLYAAGVAGKTPSSALCGAIHVLAGEGEQLPRGHGVRMVAAQDPLPRLQGLLEQRDRLAAPARVPVGGRQVMPRVQGARVLGAQQPLPVRQGLLV